MPNIGPLSLGALPAPSSGGLFPALAQGAEAYFQAHRQKQEEDRARQQLQLQKDQYERQVAGQQLDNVQKMLASRPDDPNLLAQANKLREKLGLGNVPTKALPNAPLTSAPTSDGGPSVQGGGRQIQIPGAVGAPQQYDGNKGPLGFGTSNVGPNTNITTPQYQMPGVSPQQAQLPSSVLPAPTIPGQQQQQVADVNALFGATPHSPNEKEVEMLMGLPADKRRAVAQSLGVMGDDTFFSLPMHYAPGSKEYQNAQGQFQKLNFEAINKGWTPKQFTQAFSAQKNIFGAADIDVNSVDPDTLATLNRALQAKIDADIARGVHFSNQDLNALRNANSLEQLRAAEAKLYGEKARTWGQNEDMKWKHWQAQDGNNAKRANAYVSRVTELNKQAQNGNKFAVQQILQLSRMADGDVKASESALNNARRLYDDLVNNQGLDTSDPQVKNVAGTIDQLTTQLDEAKTTKSAMLQQYSGKTGIQASLSSSGLPNTNQVTAVKVDKSKAERTATGPGGKKIYKIDGKWVDATGKQY